MESRSINRTLKPIFGFLYLLISLLMPAAAVAKELPQEFTAKYALEMFGTVLARATYTLQHTDNGVTMTQSTRPAGLVALLRKDKIDVRSDMVMDNGRLLCPSRRASRFSP